MRLLLFLKQGGRALSKASEKNRHAIATESILWGRWFVFCLLFLGASLSGEVLNFHAGDTSRGGFGDVAANVIMAQQLHRQRPGAKIHMLVPERTLAALAVLEPETLGFESSVTVNGITYHREGKSVLPMGDVAMVFAAETDYPSLEKSAPLLLTFEEYTYAPGKAHITQYSYASPTGTAKQLGLSAGLGMGTSGLYVTQGKLAPPHSRSELFEALDELPGGFVGDIEEQYQGVKLGFAYSYKPQVTEAYVKAMIKEAGRAENSAQKYLLVTQHPINEVVPPNLEVRYYKKIPFQLTNSIIAHSDLPVLVTGDVSVSLAIQHEKPFFYEGLSWKAEFARGLVKKLVKADPSLKSNLTVSRMLKEIYPGDMLYSRMELGSLVESMHGALQNEETLGKISKGLAKIKRVYSMPKKIDRFLTILQEMGASALPQSSQILEYILAGKSKEYIQNELKKLKPLSAVSNGISSPEVIPASALTTQQTVSEWSGSPGEIAASIASLEAGERREKLEQLAQEAPADIREKVIEHLSRHRHTLNQMQTIQGCRDVLSKIGN